RARSRSPPRRRYPTASATSSATARMQWTVRGGSRAGRSACSAARCSRAARSAEVAMRTSRWVLAILVTASTVLAAVSVGVRRGEGGGFPPPSSGSLLPFDSTLLGPPRNLATLIDTGLDVVEDVATIGDTVLMLSHSSWRVVTGTRTRGPIGAEPPGSPQGIHRPTGIIAADTTDYILGTERREGSGWPRPGSVIERRGTAAPATVRRWKDMAGVDGRVFAVAQVLDRGSMQWIVLERRWDVEPV